MFEKEKHMLRVFFLPWTPKCHIIKVCFAVQVYQEKGLRDKERYKNEMSEYKSSYDVEEPQ